jgi:hypothetical protein
MSYSISTGGELRIFPYKSRFGAFDSRLGWANSRFRLLREFAGKQLIRLAIIATKRQFHWENR